MNIYKNKSLKQEVWDNGTGNEKELHFLPGNEKMNLGDSHLSLVEECTLLLQNVYLMNPLYFFFSVHILPLVYVQGKRH